MLAHRWATPATPGLLGSRASPSCGWLVILIAMVDRSAIKSFCRAVAKQFRPQAIILFGSYAYGHPTPDSDVDLLVIMPKRRERGERMSVRIRHAVPRNFPMDLLVRTPKEVAQRIRWGDVFVREVMEKGQVMYEANDTRVGEKS